MNASDSSAATRVVLAVALAGLAGEIAFEIYAHLISPALFGVALQPANLVIALGRMATGATPSYSAAFAVHALIGTLGFAAFVLAVRQLMPERVLLTGVLSGLVLWFVAQGLLAPVIGRPFMMNFGTYTQSSFIGHVGMTIIMAYALSRLLAPVRARSTAPVSGEPA